MHLAFPSLNIEMTIDKVAFTLFSIPIYWYGIIIAMGFACGLIVASLVAKKLGEKTDIVLDLALICAPVAIVCARAYYVIFQWDNYKDDFASIFDLRSGGIAIYGAIIGAVITALVFCKVRKKETLKIFDIGAFGLVTGQMIGRWGNFVNQEAFGTNTALPWGMTGDGIKEYLETLFQKGYDVSPQMPVHPTFLYESLWSLLTLVLLFVIILKCYKYSGQAFFAYISMYGLGRFWIEGLRTDSLMLGNFRISQIIALICFIVFSVLYFVFLHKSKDK